MTATLIGPGGNVTVANEVEVKNDAGSPLAVSGPLTDSQLRAAPVPVDITDASVTIAEPVTVDGTVGLDAASLAALETVQVGSLPAVALDSATLNALEEVEARGPKRGLQLDYGARTDSQPVYLGSAPPATAAAAVAWTVTKFAYESGSADARITRSDVRSPMAWTNRADPTADGLPAWGF